MEKKMDGSLKLIGRLYIHHQSLCAMSIIINSSLDYIEQYNEWKSKSGRWTIKFQCSVEVTASSYSDKNVDVIYSSICTAPVKLSLN